MQPGKNWRLLIALLAIVGLLGAACGSDDDEGGDTGGDVEAGDFEEGTTMAKLQEAGTIKIGVKYDVPLFGFKNPQSGEVEGFDIELGKLVAAKLGAEPEFVEAISDNRIPFLQSGEVDLVFSTMTITTDRDAEIDFSRPYYIAHGRILVAKDSGIASSDDLGGKKVCTALGSTYEALIPDVAPEADLKLVDSYSECFTLLQNEQADALVTDDVILSGFLQQDDNFEIVGDDLTTDPYGAGVKEGDKEFADFVSGVIEETFEDGTWDELYDEWIGQYTGQPAEDPSKFTLEDAFDIYKCDETC